MTCREKERRLRVALGAILHAMPEDLSLFTAKQQVWIKFAQDEFDRVAWGLDNPKALLPRRRHSVKP